jgi:radial spoke head protein 4/6
LLNLNS